MGRASHRMRVRAARRATWCLVSVLLAGGCLRSVERERYPPTWRSLRAEGCHAIVGTYENLGEGEEALFQLLVAAYYLGTPRPNGANAPGGVTISMPEPGVLEARTGSLNQRFLARNREFACSDGGLKFARTSGKCCDDMVAWFGSTVVRIAKDEDGWLVVSDDTRVFALLVYIPLYSSRVTWSRFKPVTDAQ